MAIMDEKKRKQLESYIASLIPYGIKARYWNSEDARYYVDTVEGFDMSDRRGFYLGEYVLAVGEFKPYLRKREDMTLVEREQCLELMQSFFSDGKCALWDGRNIDFYNEILVDAHNLIEDGFAIEAPEGMYNF